MTKDEEDDSESDDPVLPDEKVTLHGDSYFKEAEELRRSTL